MFLNMKNNRDNVYDCTSSNFDGLIASCKPDDSWVCKWQRISKFKQGVYAVSVSGRLPQSVIRDMVISTLLLKKSFLIFDFFFHFRREVVYPTDQGTQVNDNLHFEISNVLSVQNKTMTTISKKASKSRPLTYLSETLDFFRIDF